MTASNAKESQSEFPVILSASVLPVLLCCCYCCCCCYLRFLKSRLQLQTVRRPWIPQLTCKSKSLSWKFRVSMTPVQIQMSNNQLLQLSNCRCIDATDAERQIADRISRSYRWLFDKQRPVAHAAFQQLLFSLQQLPCLLQRVLTSLVSSILTHTLSTGDQANPQASGVHTCPQLPQLNLLYDVCSSWQHLIK